MSAAPPRRRQVRRVALVLAAVLGLPLLLGIGFYGYLHSAPGGQRLRGIALQAVSGNIAGRLAIGGLHLDGAALHLTHVTLQTPEGETVATLEELSGKVSLPALLHHSVELSDVRVHGLGLLLREDSQGLNLGRALAAPPGAKISPVTGKTPGPWKIRVTALALDESSVDFWLRPQGLHVHLASILAQGDASLGAGLSDLLAQATASGQMTEPTEGPVHVMLHGVGVGEQRTLEVTLQAAGLKAKGGVTLGGAGALQLSLEQLHVTPEIARALVPSYPVQVPVDLHGTARRKGALLSADLSGAAGAARVSLKGDLDLASMRSPGLSLEVHHVNLEELIKDGPKSDLGVTLQGAGGGSTLKTLSGHASLTMAASRVRGRAVGPIRAQLVAGRGTLSVPALELMLPGVKLTGKGHATLERVHFEGQLQATDLSALARTFGGIADTALPRVSGNGSLSVKIDGPVRHPGLWANGNFTSVRYEGKSARSLELKVEMPDVGKPLEADATLHAHQLLLGSHAFEDVEASFNTKGREVDGNLTSHGLANVVIHLGGILDKDGDGIELSELIVKYPEAPDWMLTAPAHLRFPEATFTSTPIALRSAAQTLLLSVQKTKRRLHLDARGDGLDLSRLPGLVTRGEKGLGGTLSFQATAEGTPSAPEVELSAALEEGRFRTLTKLGGAVQAHYGKETLGGKLSLRILQTTLNGKFNLPLDAMREHRHVAVGGALFVEALELGPSLCTLVQAGLLSAGCDSRLGPSLQGKVTAQAELTGTADAPHLILTVGGKGLRNGMLPPSDGTLVLRTDSAHRLGATLELTNAVGKGRLEVESPLELSDIWDHPPSTQQLLKTPLRVTLSTGALSVAALHQAGYISDEAEGTLGIHAKLQGPLSAPLGTVEVNGSALHMAGTDPATVMARLSSTETELVLELDAKNAKGPIASVKGSVQTSPGRLWAGGALDQLPVEVRGTLGPLSLKDLPITVGQGRMAHKLQGTLTGKVTGSGTPNAPSLQAELHAQQLPRAGEVSIGGLDFTYRYAKGQHEAYLGLKSSGGGELSARGHATLDLSYAALTRPIAFSQAPLKLQVSAHAFNLAALGSSIPLTRSVGGKLGAEISMEGTLASPVYRGTAELQNGALELEGYGEYDGIGLSATASNDLLTIQQLTAHSEGGTLRLTGRAARDGQRWLITGDGQVDTFPVVIDDQRIATTTLKTRVTGSAEGPSVALALAIPEAHIKLPNAKAKEIQDLKRPDDIILVTRGLPRDKSKRGRRAVMIAESRPRLYAVTLTAPRNLWIEGSNVQGKKGDVALEVGLSDQFRVEYQSALQIYGDVRIIRGRVEALGRRFDLQRNSSVRFTGAPTEPTLAITAIYNDVPDGIKVFLGVVGQGKDITLKPTSEPPLTESEIYTLLATGRTTLKGGSGSADSSPFSSGQAASVLGSLIATQLKQALSSKLPLDVVSVEAGDETHGLSGSVEAGRYFGDKFYLGYQGRLGADPTRYENSNSVRMEYQFSPRWSAQAEYGDARRGALDLIWSRDY